MLRPGTCGQVSEIEKAEEARNEWQGGVALKKITRDLNLFFFFVVAVWFCCIFLWGEGEFWAVPPMFKNDSSSTKEPGIKLGLATCKTKALTSFDIL